MTNGIRKYGLKRMIIGSFHKLRNMALYKRFGFELWHITPIEFRQYAVDLRHIANEYYEMGRLSKKGLTVEIGCGLAEIVGGVQSKRRIGVDRSQEVINAASHLYPNVLFKLGSFQTIKGYDIELLIMVNFIHEIDLESLKNNIQELLYENRVKMIVIDRIENIDNSNYKYSHDGRVLFAGTGYVRTDLSVAYPAEGGAIRYVEWWEKR